jgi:glycosyltransferase involved in cell wall biosynthesis
MNRSAGAAVFSVIIPLYNKRATIRRTLDSVFAQEGSDFDVIVVNDGSTDGGEDIVAALRDRRITLLSQENQGVSAARNRGAAASSAPYLAFIDADDEWTPSFLPGMRNLIARCPDAALYAGGFIRHGRRDASRVTLYGMGHDRACRYIELFRAWRKREIMCMGSVVFARQAFLELGGFDTSIRQNEDWILFARLALAGYRVAYCRDHVLHYHNLAGSASKRPTGNDFMPFLRWLAANYEAHQADRHFAAFVKQRLQQSLLWEHHVGNRAKAGAIFDTLGGNRILPLACRLYRWKLFWIAYLPYAIRMYAPDVRRRLGWERG